MTTSDPGHARPHLDDLLEGLTWPQLLRAVPLALRPGRLGVAFFALLVVWLLAGLPTYWGKEHMGELAIERKAAALADALEGAPALASGESAPVAAAMGRLYFDLPAELARTYPVEVVLLGVPIVLVWLLAGASLCRMVACDASQGVVLNWPQGLAFGVSRLGSSAAGVLGPLGVAAALLLLIAAAGWALFSLSLLSVVGGLAYPLMLLGSLLATILLLAYLLGAWLILPAIACEGTDAIDAAQRAYSYVLARPLRLVMYGAAALVAGIVSAAVVGLVISMTVALARGAATLWLGDAAAGTFAGEGLTGMRAAAGWLVGLWEGLAAMFFGAYVVSYIFSASTLVYLCIRRVHDGQDLGEIWMPGMVEGTMAQAMSARAEALGASSAREGRLGAGQGRGEE